MRSSINFFTLNSLDLENNVFIKRLFKYFYQVKPLKARYSTYWPVSKLLNFLKSWHPENSLSLKQLTLKTVALIALTSSDRGQTIHLAKTTNMILEEDNSIKFVIKDRTKTTRRTLRPKIINCCNSEMEELNVANCVRFYLDATKEFRLSNLNNGENLFYSWKTKKPVSKPTIARWLKLVLKLAGIDTNQFTAHSYRGAGLSSAFFRGASIGQIISAGNWKNVNIFKDHYCAPSYESSLGNMILNDC